MKLLTADVEEVQAAMKRHSQQGVSLIIGLLFWTLADNFVLFVYDQNREAAKMERNRLKRLRKLHGIYPSISMLNLAQLPMHMTFMSLINRLAYNYEAAPAMTTEGFFWFTDLSSPDPFFILPCIGGILNALNILNTTVSHSNTTMRKMRRYLIIMPLISIPVQMTFPAAFNLYWIASSSVQLAILTGFRMDNFRRFMGVPDYLPGSKLEKQHIAAVHRQTGQRTVAQS